eukprot:jgi/Tetstr1/461474/TSEL_006580.t2
MTTLLEFKTMRYGVKYTAVPRATYGCHRFERSLLGDIQGGLAARDAAWHNAEPGQKGPLRDILDMSEYTGMVFGTVCGGGAAMSVYAAAAADVGKKLKRQATPTKTSSSRRDWDFTTTGGGGWAPLENAGAGPGAGAQEQPRPSTTGSAGGGGSGKLSCSPPRRRETLAEEEPLQRGSPKEPPASGGGSKAKPAKASADLSPYMMNSPYISRAGLTSHSRPVSRNGPTATSPSSRPSLASSVYSSPRRVGRPAAPRPFTPNHPSRPQTVDIGAVRPSTRPAGYSSSASLGAPPETPQAGGPQAGGPHRCSSLSTSASGLQAYLSSRDAVGASLSGTPQAGAFSQSSGRAAGYHDLGEEAPAEQPAPGSKAVDRADLTGTRCEGLSATKVYQAAVLHGSAPSRGDPRPGSVSGAAAPGPRLTTAPHEPAKSRPSSSTHAPRATASAKRSNAPAASAATPARSSPGLGHKVAAMALSGLGPVPESRPTTQERHAAQREQLGFGTRPTTQERRQLASRAGPRSERFESPPPNQAPRPTSRGGRSEALQQSRSTGQSQTTDPSRLSGIAGTALARPGTSGGRPSSGRSSSVRGGSRSGARPAAEEVTPAASLPSQSGSAGAVPVIIENVEGEAYGMTLGDYINQMASTPSRPQSGVSATMAEEDCIPPDNASLLSDCSDYSYVDSEVNEGDFLDDDYYSSGYSDSSPLDGEPMMGVWDAIPSGTSFTSAIGNGLDLRPATAAPQGLLSKHAGNVNDNVGSTREVDLGSLPAALFHPRGEGSVPRPQGSGRSDSVWHDTSRRRMSGRSGRSSQGAPGKAPKAAPSRGDAVGRPRKTQSARPITVPGGGEGPDGGEDSEYEEAGDDLDDDGSWDDAVACVHQRPPSRQRPPPEALHLFNALGQGTKGALKPSMSIKQGASDQPRAVRPSTTAGPSRPLSGPQLRLKNDGSGLAQATKAEMSKMSKMTRPPSRQKAELMSAGIRHNAVEDFPDRPPKGQGVYDLDIMGLSDSDC